MWIERFTLSSGRDRRERERISRLDRGRIERTGTLKMSGQILVKMEVDSKWVADRDFKVIQKRSRKDSNSNRKLTVKEQRSGSGKSDPKAAKMPITRFAQ